MASLARVLLAVGLLVAVVIAAPQQQSSHPLRDTYSPSTERESSATEHGFSKSRGSDDSNENINKVDEDTESASEEVHGTHNQGSTDGETATTQRDNYNPFFSSFGVGSQHSHGVSVDEEVHSTHNEDSTDGETVTTQRYNDNPFFSSFGVGSQHSHGVSVDEEAHGKQNEDTTDGETLTTSVTTQHFNYNPDSSFGSGNHQTDSETPSFNQDDVDSYSSANNHNFGQDNVRTYDAYGPTFGRHPSHSQF